LAFLLCVHFNFYWLYNLVSSIGCFLVGCFIRNFQDSEQMGICFGVLFSHYYGVKVGLKCVIFFYKISLKYNY